MSYCIINGQLLKEEDASIPIDDRGFRYGDSVFETIAIHAGVPYQFDWHIARLASGLQAIKIIFDAQILKIQCKKLLKENAAQQGILRIQVSRGVGSMGYLPNPKAPHAGAHYVIQTTPMPIISRQPVALWKSSYQKISAEALPVQHKLGQGLNSILARIEAAEHECAEALLCNQQQELCETSSGNLFWLKAGTLYTPALTCGVLNGATRHAVMRLSPYPVEESQTSIETLHSAEAIFITNVVWKTLAIGLLLPENWGWNSQPLAKQFYQLIHNDREAYSRQHINEWAA